MSVTTVTVAVITQPDNTTACARGTAVFTCVVEFQNVNISTEDIKWWRIRIDVVSNAPLFIRENIRFIVTSNISGGVLTSVLMITDLRTAFIGPYWLGMVDGTQLSNVAYLSIVPNGMCMCCVCTNMYVYMYVCMYVHMYACIYVPYSLKLLRTKIFMDYVVF